MASDTITNGLKTYAIGSKLRRLRLRKSMGLVELSQHTGLSPALLSKLERDLMHPTLPTLLRIALVFSVGLEYFCSEGDDLWQMAMGTHPSLEGLDDDALARRRQALFTPAWTTRLELVRSRLLPDNARSLVARPFASRSCAAFSPRTSSGTSEEQRSTPTPASTSHRARPSRCCTEWTTS